MAAHFNKSILSLRSRAKADLQRWTMSSVPFTVADNTRNLTETEAGFGSAIKTARNLLGLSQRALAERAQLSPSQVSEVERGARDPF
jgi:ribosome-binding protein aMBF1 (putative translation factor)